MPNKQGGVAINIVMLPAQIERLDKLGAYLGRSRSNLLQEAATVLINNYSRWLEERFGDKSPLARVH